MPLGTEIGLSPGDSVLDGDPAPSPQIWGGTPSQFSVHFYCGQTAGCIKMPLGMELGFSPGNFVLDEDPALYLRRGGAHPIFGTRLLWPNGCMDQDATWYGVRPQPRQLCVR